MAIDTARLDGGDRILAVDHQPRLLDSLRALAGANDLPLDTAETADEAMDLLASGRYCVLLVDLLHPEKAGQQLMRFASERGLELHVVVSTTDPSQSVAVQALRNGARDFLRKPYAPEELVLTLGNALDNRRLTRENRFYQNRLHRSEQLYRFIVDRSPDMIYILDPDGRFTFLNSTAERLLGYRPESLLGRHYEQLVLPEDLPLARHGMNDRRTGERATRNLELRLLRSGDGPDEQRMVVVEVNAMGIYAQAEDSQPGALLGTYGIVRDITERKHAEAMIRYQAYHDLLTGLPNRALFKDRLMATISRNQRSGEKLAVLFLDLDRFKMVNDSLGHSVGDTLLERVAQRLRRCLREGDTLARLGGDEFTVLLPAIQTEMDAIRVSEKCVKALEEPFQVDDRELYLGVSIGIAIAPDHGETVETLVKHADVAMYHVKEQGRGRWAVFEPVMSSRVDHHVNLEHGLRHALEKNELRLAYQPQIDVEVGRVTAVEALVRWQHPTLGLISPMEFIPVAEQTGAIVGISRWVLREACRGVLSWPTANRQGIRLAVNLSPLHVGQPDFVQDILGILQEEGFPPQRLELEITEHLLMSNLDNVVGKLRQLTAHGVSFAVDDFGTGYSSLSYLQRLPIQTLKIDQSFIRALAEGSESHKLVGAIIAMGQGLGLKIVAEGVETHGQLQHLRKLQCMQMQGYLFGKPSETLLEDEELGQRWRAAVGVS
ncbi:MAG: EAL domain-containing protein [Ectothiorhodospiraceae bacterium]|nr:EAL domain-containing protein [Ectothiorhodospiraceae bacterium]